jgi:[acyl-carrier-protein] S-malonyltransferase
MEGRDTMGKIAFVFPGQGAQTVGMGKDIYGIPEVKQIFQAADEAVGFALTNIVFNGPEDQLKQTANTQPALLATSFAYLEFFKQAGGTDIQPDYVAGHSLGEWTALVTAGALRLADATKLVHMRGRFMEGAVPGGRGAMAAVLGAQREALQDLCIQISADVGQVELANVNCPGQIVVSGTAEGVQAVVVRGKDIGAKRVIPLEVSGPFHSSLMQPAAEKLSDLLETIHIQAPQVPFVANVTADVVTVCEPIRELLTRQVCAPVLWEDSITRLISLGVDTFVEFGPGSVLSGLIKKIDRNVHTISINSADAAQSALTHFS